MDAQISPVLNAMPGLIWMATPQGQPTFFNLGWCKYTGLSESTILDHGWQDLIHPEDLPAFLALWENMSGSPQGFAAPARLRRFDGEYRRFLLSAGRSIHAASGAIDGWCGIATAVEEHGNLRDAERWQRAEAILATETRLLEMIASGRPLSAVLQAFCESVEGPSGGAACTVLLLDAGGTRLRVGAAPRLPEHLKTLLEVPAINSDLGPCAAAVVLRKQVIVADIASDTRWPTAAWCQLVLDAGLRAVWSTPIMSGTGQVLGTFAIYYRESGVPTPLHQTLIERFTHLAGIAIERAERETTLKRSQALFTQAQRLSSTGSFSWRIANDHIVWSEEIYRIFELDAESPLTRERIGGRIHPEDLDSFLSMMARAAQADGGDFEMEREHRLQMPDGSIKYIHTVANRSRDEDGQLEYIGAVQDVTGRRRSELALGKARAELAHASRMTSLGALTASIAHEVNQPLFGIINNANACLRMLASDRPNIEGAQETARRTLRDANRASDVILRLRALFGKKEVTMAPVNLNDAAREVIALSLSELERNDTVIQLELVDDIPSILGDRVQLQQVILNLILNASDAMNTIHDRPRYLLIRSELNDVGSVQLTIRDAGIGLTPESLDKLFEAFYTTKSHGMGIGLSVSRSIIENHGGRIWAISNEGPGATFAFTIPRSRESPDTSAPNAAASDYIEQFTGHW